MVTTPKTLPLWKKLFADNLQKLIKTSGLTDNEYRQRAGYSSQTWYCYVRGTRIPSNPSDVEKLTAVVGANPAVLFGWHDVSALPAPVRECQHAELTSPQLGYAVGSMVHFDPTKTGLSDGVFVIEVNGNPLLRRVTARLDQQIDVSDGVQTQAYNPDAFSTFKVLGKVTGVTALL